MPEQRTIDHLGALPEVVDAASIEGRTLSGRRNVIVHGEVVGDSDVDGAVFLGANSRWVGNLTAEVVVIKGRMEGNVRAHQKVEVRGAAQVHGNLKGPVVALAKGVCIHGDVALDSCVVYFEERRG